MKVNTAISLNYGTGNVINATTTSAQSTITGAGRLVRVVNFGTDLVFVKLGTGTVTATSSDLAVLSGQSVTLVRNNTDTSNNVIAAVAAATTAKVYYITGE